MYDGYQELRIVLRRLLRTPGFTCTILLTLAVGIGATTAVFNVVNGILLRPLPHPEARELVALWEVNRRVNPPSTHTNVSVANFGDWRARNRVFQDMAAYSIGQSTLSGAGEAEMVTRAWVTADFFPLLRGRAALGRVFTPREDTPDGPAVAVLGHAFWAARFGRDPGVLGRSVELNGVSWEIIGVLEEGIDFLDRGVQIWTPYGISPSAYQDRESHSLQVIARMRPGVSVVQAQAELNGIADALRLEHPEAMTGYGVRVVSLRDEMVGQARPALLALLAGVAVMLLIATLNVANLILVRGWGRSRERAVRQALGCTTGRLGRESLLEALSLGLTGGGMGILLGWAGTRGLLALGPGTLPRVGDIALDGRVLAVAFGASLLASLLFGFLPALGGDSRELAESLREGGRSSTAGGRRRARSGLVVAEVAFSMVLLVAAGFLVRTFLALSSVSPGFATENTLTAKVRLPAADYPDRASMVDFYDRLLARVEALPQVTAAGFTRFLPMSDGPWTFPFELEGRAPDAEGPETSVGFHAVAGHYFRASRIPLVQGRLLSPADDAGGAPAVLINETMARRFWPGEDPLGRRIRFHDPEEGPGEWRTIVGVVGDVKHEGLQREAIPTVYGPLSQAFPVLANRMRLVARTAGDPLALASTLRSIVNELDPKLPVFDIRSTGEIVSAQVARPRFSMLVLAGFALAAALLALVGVYGVVSDSVAQRTREIGLRMALGARAPRLVGRVVSEGMALTGLGIGIGAPGAFALTPLAGSLLFGVEPSDPLTFAAVAAFLGLAAALASLVPATRAARVDPASVIKGD